MGFIVTYEVCFVEMKEDHTVKIPLENTDKIIGFVDGEVVYLREIDRK